MNGRIGHLHCRYRMVGGNGAGNAVAARLDHLAKGRLAETLEQALDQALAGDPTVYVLRRVEARLGLRLNGDLTDTQIAQRWAERIAGAIMRTIAQDPDDGGNLVRFVDQADYVARFVVDLLHGSAWSQWYYGSLRSLQHRSMPDVLRSVLLDNRDHLPAILGNLQRCGVLERLLDALDAATHRLLWTQGLGAYVGTDPEVVRPLFMHALRLLDELELWARPRPDPEMLLRLYLATGPPPADWRDRGGLAAAVVHTLRFLANRGYVQMPGDQPAGDFLSRLDQVLREFDWLDSDMVRVALLAPRSAADSQETDLPVRPAGRGPTPRQRELLADLIALLRKGRLTLDRSWPDSPANALRLYASLVESVPRWAGDSLATGTIQRLLAAWAFLMQTQSPTEATRRLRPGNAAAALRLLPEANQAAAQSALSYLAGLGTPGVAIAEVLVCDGQGASPAPGGGRGALAGLAQALAGLNTAEISLIQTILGGASAQTLRRLQQGDVVAIFDVLGADCRAKITGLVADLAGLDAGDLAQIKAILAGASTETLCRLQEGDVEAALPTLAEDRLARIAGFLQTLAELDVGDREVVTSLVGSASAGILPKRGDAKSALPAIPDDTRARLASVLDALESLDGTERALVRASASDAVWETRRELSQGDIEALVRDLYAAANERLTAGLKAYAGLDEPGMTLARLLTAGATMGSLRQLQEEGAAVAVQTLLEDSGSGIPHVLESLAGLEESDLAEVRRLVTTEDDLPALDMGVDTGCAGVFLLLRAVLDARLPALLQGEDYPPRRTYGRESDPDLRRRAGSGLTRLGAALVALGLRWAGEPGLNGGRIDAGLSVLAMPERPFTLEVLRDAWSQAKPEDHFRFQVALLRILAAQRLVRGSTLRLYHVDDTALVAGSEMGDVWPLGRTVETTAEARETLERWLDAWEGATGQRPELLTCDASLADVVGSQLHSETPEVVVVPGTELSGSGDASDESIEAHQAGRAALLEALEAMEPGRLDLPDVDLTLALTAIALLRLWARWLRQFEASSVPYLLKNIVRRPGWIYADADRILIEMEPRPLDIVIEMAGYTADLERIPWLGDRRVQFQLRE